MTRRDTHRPAMGTTTRDNALETGRTADAVGFVLVRTADECAYHSGEPLVMVDDWRPIATADVFLAPAPQPIKDAPMTR